MIVPFSPERSDAIRSQLIQTATSASTVRRSGLWAASLILAGSLAGAGVSTAAFAATGSFSPSDRAGTVRQTGGPDAVPAPPGTEPGSPIISTIGPPQSLRIAEPTEVSLDDRPETATHVRVTLTAESPGRISWGTDPGGNNPSASFSRTDIGKPSAVTWYDFPLDGSTSRLYFDTASAVGATATVQYLRYVPTLFEVNDDGRSFGAEGGPDGTPDLVRVSGVAPDGSMVEGYASAEDLNAFSPDHPGQPANPKEALAWQAEREERYPDGWDIPIYESDGRTQIGTFHIGN